MLAVGNGLKFFHAVAAPLSKFVMVRSAVTNGSRTHVLVRGMTFNLAKAARISLALGTFFMVSQVKLHASQQKSFWDKAAIF
jgi:hypothetical protein